MARSKDVFDELLEDVDEADSTQEEFDLVSTCKRLYQSPYYNICLLALAWAMTLTTSTLLTTVGPLSVSSLGASDSVATFSIGIFLIGARYHLCHQGGSLVRWGGRRAF